MSHPNPSTALATVVVDELARNGVTHVVLAPGSRSAPLAFAAAAHPGVVVHTEIDERSAGFLAVGMGRETGRPAAVLTTSGTAAVNLHPSVVEADLGRVPLLVLTADRPPELHDVGANQTIDQRHLFGGSVRWEGALGPAEDLPGANSWWRSVICRGVGEATGAPPGPVHLDLAFREPLVPLTDDGRSVASPFRSVTGGRGGGAPWTSRSPAPIPVVPLSDDVVAEERGLVVAGDLGPTVATGVIAGELAARLGWPLVAEPTAGTRPAQAISTAHHLFTHPRFVDEFRPEVVLVVGRAVLDRGLARLCRRTRVVVADPWGWPDPGRLAVEMLAGIPAPPGDVPARTSGWRRAWLGVERTVRQALDQALDGFETVTEPRVARDVAALLDGDDRLVVSSSMPIRDLDRFMAPGPVRVHANRGASGIDGFVSTVLGVAAGHGGRTLGLAGDLAMLHDASGLLVRPRPDAVFVVVNNDGGGIFSFLPQARFPDRFEELFAAPHGRSFQAMATFYGVGHHRVDEPDGLVAAVEGAFADGGIQIVEVATDRLRNVEVHDHLAQVATEALDRWLEDPVRARGHPSSPEV